MLVTTVSKHITLITASDLLVILLGIRANPNVGTTGFTDGINSAIFRYEGAEEEEPSTIQNTEGTSLDEADLHPLENPGAVSYCNLCIITQGLSDIVYSLVKLTQEVLTTRLTST